MTTENMREMGQAAEELLKLRGPKYNMSAHEAEEQLRELEKEESMERVYVCSQYGSRGEKATNLELAKFFCMMVIEGGRSRSALICFIPRCSTMM